MNTFFFLHSGRWASIPRYAQSLPGPRFHLRPSSRASIIIENDAYRLRLSCYIHCNPLRARIISRLAEYKWSSYRHYAYGKKPPVWLNTRDILNELSGEDLNKAYRIKVQQYSDEQNSVWEDVKHGPIYGSQQYKSKFFKGKYKQ
jgi:putative transposase